MNTIKNAIVTVTLLAVGYGAYVILNSPPAGDFNQFAPESASESLTSTAQALPAVDIEVPSESVADPQSDAAISSSVDDSRPGGLPPLDLPEQATPLAPPTDLSSDASAGQLPPSQFEEHPPLVAPPLSASEASPLSLTSPQTESLGNADASRFENVGESSSPTPDVVDLPPPADSDQFPVAADGTTAAQATPVDQPSLGAVPPAGEAETGSGPFEQVWQTTQQQIRDRDLVEALATLSPWYNDPTLSTQQRARCMQLLDQLAGTVIYSRQHLLEQEYHVMAGETLDEIAARYGVTQELLAKINGIAPPYALATGEKLKLVRGPFRAEVNVSTTELTLFLGPYYAGRFTTQIGHDLPPQEAFYEVAEKSNGRSYFDRRMGREVLRGEAANRYGDHWLGLRGDQITTGHSVGIHGRPNSPPTTDIGSISLDPLDAEDVFAILSIGSRVQIRR